jgi:hypothetical protein
MFAYPALLLLLLAGFFPALASASLRYRLTAVNGWRLLLESLILGSLFAFIGAALSAGIPALGLIGKAIAAALAPYSDAMSREAGIVLPPGIALAPVISLVASVLILIGERVYLGGGMIGQRIAAQIAGPIHEALLDAMHQKEQVMVSLSWGKVYVGHVTKLPDPSTAIEGKGSFRFLPMAGGHRDKDTKQVFLTDNYAEALNAWRSSRLGAQLPANLAKKLEETSGIDFTVNLKCEDIELVRRFDQGLFEEFDKLKPKQAPRTQAGKSRTKS